MHECLLTYIYTCTTHYIVIIFNCVFVAIRLMGGRGGGQTEHLVAPSCLEPPNTSLEPPTAASDASLRRAKKGGCGPETRD